MDKTGWIFLKVAVMNGRSWQRQLRNVFYNNTLIKFISYRKENVGSKYITNLEVAEQKLLQLQIRLKCTARFLKETKKSVHDRNSVITQLLFTKHSVNIQTLDALNAITQHDE